MIGTREQCFLSQYDNEAGKKKTMRQSVIEKDPHIRFQIPVKEGGRRMIERSINAYFRGEPDVMQVKDVVRLLHCSKNTVYALIKSGTLESVKVGRNILIPKSLLVEFLMRDKNFFVLRPDPPRRR